MLDCWLWDVVDRGSMERVGDTPRETRVLQSFPKGWGTHPAKRAFYRAFRDLNPLNERVGDTPSETRVLQSFP